MHLEDEDADAVRILLAKYADRLTDRESQFLEDLANQDWITEPQKEWLDRIWARLVARG